MQDTELPEKIDPTSLNFQTELAAQLAELVPEAMSDGKLDVTKLREMVNGDAENSPEKFGLFWPGKRAAQALAQIPTTATLVPAPEESVDWDNTKNIFIEGDNLEVLKALQNSYRRKVKMIYIDPPYNTGKEFIYPDKFSEGLQGYLEYTGQKNEAGENVESKPETGGRKHSNWLSMMYPRLQLAKSLMTNDGVIFISIGDDEHANLRKIGEEVFGEENFIGDIAVKSTPGGKQASSNLSSMGDYVLVFGKGNESKILGTPLTENEMAKYNLEDADGRYLTGRLRQHGIAERREDVPTLYFPIYFNQQTKDISTTHKQGYDVEVLPILPAGGDGRWIWSKEKIERDKKFILIKQVKRGDAYVWDAYFKKYYDNSMRTKLPSILLDNDVRTEVGSKGVRALFDGNKYFDFPKPVYLIKKLIDSIGDDECIVLDFFSGSGTTAQAVVELNAEDGGRRKHIQVQLPELTDTRSDAFKAGHKTIADISKERIRRAGKKIREDYAEKIAKRITLLDTGFRVYKLAPSNFVQWDENKAKDDIQQSVLDFAANKKPDAAPESLLTEIMLQARMPLSANIEKRDLQSGGWVFVVDGGNLIAYVANEQITEAQANEIADLAPAKLIVLDSAFNGNNALKINVANICKEKFIKEFKTI